MDVERVPLPGIGLRHVVTTERGRRLCVVSYHTGRRDLAIYHADDPDTAHDTITLTPNEANTVAELLGTAHVVERLADLHRQVTGLVSVQLPIAPTSPYAGRPLADTHARTRTGASIVAIVRDREVIASPRPQFVFAAGDTAVVIGTEEGTTAIAQILESG